MLIIVGIIMGGVLGTFANSLVLHLMGGIPFKSTAFVPGRLAVAIACVIIVPIIYTQMGPGAAAIVSMIALTIIPSLLSKLVFKRPASWGQVLSVNAVYGVVAWFVFVLIA